MRLVLKVRAGSESGREIVIEQGPPVRIGRTSPAEFVFPQDAGISRLHFAIKCDAESARILDLNSRNGTWVNGQQVKGAVLKEGDEITAGNMKIAVHIERAQPWPAAPPAAARTAPPPSYSQPQLSVPLPLEPIPSAPPAVAKPVAPAAPELSLEERLLGMLREDFQPLYAILDAARSPPESDPQKR